MADIKSTANTVDALMSPANKGKVYPPLPLEREDIIKMLKLCGTNAYIPYRNGILIVLMWRCGLRCSEVVHIRARDINYRESTISVIGKGMKHRLVAMDDKTNRALLKFVKTHRPHYSNHFVLHPFGNSASPLHPSYVRRMVKHLAQKAGIQRRVHPHAFRHTHASELAAEKVPLSVIRDQLGHAHASTTDVYLEKIAPHERVRIIKNRGIRS